MLLKLSTLVPISILFTQIGAFAFSRGDVIKTKSVSAFKLGFDVEKGTRSGSITKRDETHVTLTNRGDAYTVKVLFGSQKSEGHVLIDTGSSDLWIKTTSSGGVYDPAGSSTHKDLNEPFAIYYVLGNATGNYVEDTIYLGDESTKIDNFQFAAANSSALIEYQGLLGIGFSGGESTKSKYPNLAYALKSLGYIDKVGYSLYLNDINATTGTILFGGVDKAKYEGDLVTVSVASPQSLRVAVNSVSIGGHNYSKSFNGLLDSGTTYTYLPDALVEIIKSELGDLSGPGSPDKFLEFAISNTVIRVPYSDLVDQDEDGEWFLAVGYHHDDSTATLGDNFLRHAYVVYDLEDETISLAGAKYTEATNIVSL